jgi:GAF domain-containing protein
MPPSDPIPSSIVGNQPDKSPVVGPRALAALHELAVAASGVLEPTALAKHAVDLACDLLGVDGAALYWWVPSTGLLHSLADNRGYQAGASRTLEPGKGVAGLAFQRQAPLIIADYPNWEGAVPWALEHGVRAAVGIPLLARGRTVGAMAVLTHAVGGFDANERRLRRPRPQRLRRHHPGQPGGRADHRAQRGRDARQDA